MRYLGITLPTAAENLALDEALLDEAEGAGRPMETLRVWEPASAVVIVGRSSAVEAEVDAAYCRREGIPVLRRSSGGAAVVAGPGCLMYAVVLSYQLRPVLRAISHAHATVLETLAAALRALAPEIRREGTSDMAIGERKVSGNSVRAKRDHLLYHGTLLYDFRLDLVSRCLKMPSRQPGYRRGRAHEDFLANLPLDRDAIRRALVGAWSATEPGSDWPRELTAELVRERYARAEWNEGRGER